MEIIINNTGLAYADIRLLSCSAVHNDGKRQMQRVARNEMTKKP
jgi:hypothetical protein